MFILKPVVSELPEIAVILWRCNSNKWRRLNLF